MTKEIINKKIGERIKIARKNANLTLLELANKIGLSEGNVQRYESGNIANVSVSVLEKFATALNTTTAILMGWENSNELQKNISNKKFSPRVERDIQKRLQSILDDMNSDAGLAFYNGDEEMDEETKELLKISLETSIRTAKKLAQEKFTPKKYKNEQSE